MEQRFARISGWGRYAPAQILTNDDLAEIVDTSDEWITSRTGIRERHIAEPHETTLTMAQTASERALAVAGISADSLDLIIVATSSPDYLLPPVSSMLQHALGASHAAAFELRAGCTGFLYGLSTAHQFLAAGTYRRVLVVGVELISRAVDWQDRNTCVLFGDGAGAVVLEATDRPTGVLGFVLGSDGAGAEALIVPGGGSRQPLSSTVLAERGQFIHMDGRAVFKFAVRVMGRALLEAVDRSGLQLSDIDLFIPHQANQRILELAARQCGIPWEKMYVNIARYGNTSAASIPIALSEAVEEGRVQEGDHLAMVSFGAGLTWGALTLRWGEGPATTEEVFGQQSIRLPQRVLRSARTSVQKARIQTTARLSPLLLPLYAMSKRVRKEENTGE